MEGARAEVGEGERREVPPPPPPPPPPHTHTPRSCGDWEAPHLNSEQLAYAATDAYASLRVYEVRAWWCMVGVGGWVG